MELLNSFQKKSANKVIAETTGKYRISREEILSKIN
jgi:hypothetical protein